jgi:hypothetical protein
VYRCHKLCQNNLDIDGKLAAFFSEELRNDAAPYLSGNANKRVASYPRL